MKLYLSSYHVGNFGHELVRLAGKGERALVVNNALDFVGDEVRPTIRDGIEELEALGLSAEDLDLREYFGHTAELRTRLLSSRLVWLRGGNSFILRRAMLASGFDAAARDLIESNALVYGGYSAGAVVATPTLRGIEIVDPPNDVPFGYTAEIPWTGMALVDYAIAPHYRSEHRESVLIDGVVAYFDAHALPYRTLRDGEVIIVE